MTAHAELGASSAVRWMTCPGSVRLSRQAPAEEDSGYAREGSAAHALGEVCLLNGEEPWEYLGEPTPQEDLQDIEVTVDMVNAVTEYTDHVRSYGYPIEEGMVERTVSLRQLGSWARDMFGTGDFILYDPANRILYVDDYKHGQGVAVSAKGNPQLKYYAVGAMLEKKLLNSVDKVVAHIIQPRAPHDEGRIRSVEYDPNELLSWAENDLKQAVLATDDPDAPLNPSEEACKFCPAKGFCPARKEQAMDNAMLDFDSEGGVEPRKPVDSLSEEEIAQILDNKKAIEDWLNGVAEYAKHCYQNGIDITAGRYKLVPGRKSRSWKDPEEAERLLRSMGFTEEDLYKYTLASPAQAENLVGKAQKKELADLIAEQEGKPTLAPASDKRPEQKRGAELDFLG